jgi:hypothetical protein
MPLVDGLAVAEDPRWLALPEPGVGASASQGTGREGNPEGHGYRSAPIGPWARLGKYLGARRAF